MANRISAVFLGLIVALAIGAGAAVPDVAAQARKPGPKTKAKKPADKNAKPFNQDMKIVVLRGLDKVTARISTFGGRVGKTVRFRSLEIVIRRCQRNRPENPPEHGAFLQIYETHPATKVRKQIFSGWMFASNPALNAMEHPVYDIWLKDCK